MNITVKMYGESGGAHAHAILRHFGFTFNNEKTFQLIYGYDLRQHFVGTYGTELSERLSRLVVTIGLRNKMLTQEEIERRKPLWQALSDLWLDSDPDEIVISYIVREMIASRLELRQIENILREEVAPAVYFNLYALPGGEWRGFDDEWLFSEVLKKIKKQKENPFYRCYVRSTVGMFVMTKMVQKDWEKIAEIYKRELSIES